MTSARTAESRQPSLDRRPVTATLARVPTHQTPPPVQSMSISSSLQRKIGNRGTLVLARSAEGPDTSSATGGLRISSPNDPAEREATSVAASVMRSADSTPVTSSAPAGIHRAGTPLSKSSGSEAPAGVSAKIARSRNGGTALPTSVRSFMEPRFGANFGSVRIHTGENAAGLSQQLNARAFTVGEHVFFGRNQFQPGRREGRELIAHELTHTIQQGATAQRSVQRKEGGGALGALADAFSSLSPEGAVRLAIKTVAPQLNTVINQGGIKDMLAEQALKAVDGVFESVRKPLDSMLGVGEQVAAALGPVVEALQAAGTQIAKNDCTPIRVAAEKIEQVAMRLLTPVIELVQPVITALKKFLDDVWKKIGAPILDWIKDYAAEQWRLIKEMAGYVQAAAVWLWDMTAGLREPYIQMWNLMKDLLGIGDSPDGRNGILQWVEQKLTQAWDAIKLRLKPYTEQLKTIGAAVGAVVLALSPVGPMLALGAAAIELGKGIAWVAANWGKGNIMATARAFVEKTLIPPLAAALDKVTASVTNIANSISAALTGLAGSLAKTAAMVGSAAIAIIVRITQWLAEQAQSLATFVNSKLAELKIWLGGAFDKLSAFLRRVMNFLSRVGDVVIDIYGLPVLLGETVWNAVPQCIRDPIVDFLGPIILRQIELFDELVKDDEAWNKTKEEVGRLIKLVFHDKNLIGAIKAAFLFVLRVFNLPPELLGTVAAKAMAAWDIVAKRPLEFIKTTIKAIAQGFKIIWGDKLENIKNGLQGWLLGEIKDKNIIMPTSWTDLGQIFEFVLSVLGISVDHVYELLEKKFPGKAQKFRQVVGKVQGVMEWVNKSIDITKSPKENAAGMLKQAKDFGMTLLESGAEWIIKKVAAKVTEEIVKAAATAGFGAILTAAQSLYAALLTAKKWMRQILDMANKALDNVMDLVGGAVAKVGGVFAELMKKGMPVVIGFLADQVGLGDVGKELGKAIDKLRANVDKAILWVIDKIKAGIDFLIGLGKSAVDAVKSWWQKRKEFTGLDGEKHEVYVDGDKLPARVIVKSTPTEIEAFLGKVIGSSKDKEVVKAANEALKLYSVTIKPVVNGRKSEDEAKAFGAQFEQLGNLLMRIVGADGGDLPDKADWAYHGPASASVSLLSKRTSKGGSGPSGDPAHWRTLQGAGLTANPHNWVRMHMITERVGGTGKPENIVLAPETVNLGSNVRGFEIRLQKLVEEENLDKKNVVWANVRMKPRTVVIPSASGPITDTATFAQSVSFEAGLHFQTKPKQWTKDAKVVLSAEVGVPPPPFTVGVPNMNDLSVTRLDALTQMGIRLATEVRRRSNEQRFETFSAFSRRMYETREAGDKLWTSTAQLAVDKVYHALQTKVLVFDKDAPR